MADILFGAPVVEHITSRTKQDMLELASCGVVPGLATVLVGNNPRSKAYVDNKIASCGKYGIRSFHETLPEGVTQHELCQVVQTLNEDPRVHGILVQMPLPTHLSTEEALRVIDPNKDVDGLHTLNAGILSKLERWPSVEAAQGSCGSLPCTPAGIMQMLEFYKIQLEGKRVAVIGRSNLVGKPVAQMLTAANATVMLCHSRTKGLREICRESQILVVAMGSPRFVTADMVKPGAVVIDVGINPTEQGLVGDVDYEAVKDIASAITPVPKGVGPVTVAMLLWNTVLLAKKSLRS